MLAAILPSDNKRLWQSRPSSHDTALAFGLVLGAGASTAIGAAAVWLVKPGIDMRIPLACSLGLSAGVMIYISFVEIFAIKSIEGFKSAGYDNAEATRFATLCFFGGMAVLWVLDKMVHGLLHFAEHYKTHWSHGLRKQASSQVQLLSATSSTVPPVPQLTDVEQATPPTNAEQTQQPVAFTGHDSNGSQAQSQAEPSNPEQPQQPNAHNSTSPREVSPAASVIGGEQALVEVEQFNRVHDTHEAVAMILRTDGKNVGLSRTGLLAAMAIGIHNLPEGLATYVATLGDPTAGVVIALAIALHNIPEGIVVAMPIYIASGSRWKGFFWGCLSGVTEPLGALLGFAVLRGGDMPPIAHGVMLGLVAGMMVWISLTELLPTAFKYDPKHTVTIAALVTGMVIMALSLILFEV